MQPASSIGGRSEKPVFHVQQQDDGCHRLEVNGRMPVDWVSNLTNGIARNGLSIIRGKASREAASSWHGHFALKCSSRSTAPEKIDYMLLSTTATISAPDNLKIDSLLVEPRTEYGGSLFVEVQGEDQFGFLGAFLDKLSFYSLFLAHMEIETKAGRILDRFWLKSAGDSQPSGEICSVLKRKLEKMLVTP